MPYTVYYDAPRLPAVSKAYLQQWMGVLRSDQTVATCNSTNNGTLCVQGKSQQTALNFSHERPFDAEPPFQHVLRIRYFIEERFFS